MIQQILLTKKQVNNITTQIYTHQAANKEQQNETPNYTAQNIQVTPNTIIILNQITSYNSILSFFKDLYYQQTALKQYNFNQTTFESIYKTKQKKKEKMKKKKFLYVGLAKLTLNFHCKFFIKLTLHFPPICETCST